MDDALVHADVALIRREHGMIVVVVGGFWGVRGQFHSLVEDIGQVECTGRQSGLAGTPLRGLWRTGECIRSTRTIELSASM